MSLQYTAASINDSITYCPGLRTRTFVHVMYAQLLMHICVLLLILTHIKIRKAGEKCLKNLLLNIDVLMW